MASISDTRLSGLWFVWLSVARAGLELRTYVRPRFRNRHPNCGSQKRTTEHESGCHPLGGVCEKSRGPRLLDSVSRGETATWTRQARRQVVQGREGTFQKEVVSTVKHFRESPWMWQCGSRWWHRCERLRRSGGGHSA